jgi:predicted metal-binding membrane protein
MNAASPDPPAPARFAPGAEAVPVLLIALAALGWWWTLRMARMDMSMAALSFVAFLIAWVAMMAAMMFPAIAPVVRLFARAAAKGHVAPLPVFVAGYLLVWSAIGAPAFFAWRALLMPIASGAPWAARLAGAVLVAAAI